MAFLLVSGIKGEISKRSVTFSRQSAGMIIGGDSVGAGLLPLPIVEAESTLGAGHRAHPAVITARFDLPGLNISGILGAHGELAPDSVEKGGAEDESGWHDLFSATETLTRPAASSEERPAPVEGEQRSARPQRGLEGGVPEDASGANVGVVPAVTHAVAADGRGEMADAGWSRRPVASADVISAPSRPLNTDADPERSQPDSGSRGRPRTPTGEAAEQPALTKQNSMHAQIASERLQMARQVPVDLTAAGERLAGPEGPRHPGKAVRPDDSPAGRQGPLQAAALGTVSGAAWKTIQQRDSVDVLRRAYDRVDGAAENDLLIVRGQESGRASGGVQGGSNPVIQISELPKVLERQVGTVVQAREVELEVKLHPEELGRVRISMSTGDGVLQVQVMAEREETLSLLRRHADLLGDALASGGFENVSFTFSEGDRNDEQRDSLWLAELEEKTVTSSATYSRGDRLDIRL